MLLRSRSHLLSVAVGALLTASALSTAAAQGLQAPVSPWNDGPMGVAERANEGFQPLGVRVGSFILRPSLTASVGYDSNVFGAVRNRTSDVVFRAAPAVTLESQWSQHQFLAEAAAEGVKYGSARQLDGLNARIGFRGRIDVSRSVNIIVNSSYVRSIDSSVAQTTLSDNIFNNQAFSFQPVTTNRFFNAATINAAFGNFVVSFGGTAQFTRYENDVLQDALVPPIINPLSLQRDSNVYTVAARVGYRVSPGSTVFVEGQVNQRDYVQQPLLNSNGYRFVGGFNADITRLLRGEVYAGVLHQNFNALIARDITTFTYGGRLRWFPTERITFTLAGSREVGDPQSFAAAPGVLTMASLTGDFEVVRRLILSLNGSISQVDYVGTGIRSDRLWQMGFGLQYYMNRHTILSLSYRYLNRNSGQTILLPVVGVVPFNYSRDLVTAGVRVQF